jgi:predicted PurR-regulated permease PerM
VLPAPRGGRIAIVLVAAFAFLAWSAYFAGSQIAQQATEMPAVLTAQLHRAMGWAQAHGVKVNPGDLNTLAHQMVTGVGPVTRALGGLIGGVTTAFVIVVLGIYIALEPRLYQRGVAWVMPETDHRDWAETAQRMGHAMRRLLAGRLVGMFSEGVATGLLLAVYGVPMAALLGLLTGLLAFLPNIGAPISGTLMVLVGFSGGTNMGLYCLAVYIVVQTVDANIVIPMVARKTVDLAPALVLSAQLLSGALFGIMGLALADPLVAMLKTALEQKSKQDEAEAAA